MRYLAIGDIHGCYTALVTLAAAVPFRPEDTVVTLGDFVDRGPDSRRVIDWLIEYGQRNQGKLIALRGNHELMMLHARTGGGLAYRSWLWNGGAATLQSYGIESEDHADLERIPEEHWKFIENELQPYFETDTHLFVHANAAADFPLNEQSPYMLYWERFDAAEPHRSGKVMVCGHTSQGSGMPVNFGYAVCIDTKAHGGQWLTCLDVESGSYWQANQFGHVRRGQIADLDNAEDE